MSERTASRRSSAASVRSRRSSAASVSSRRSGTASVSSRSSRRSSKRLSSKRKHAKKKKRNLFDRLQEEIEEDPSRIGVSLWTYSAMAWSFLTVYLLHALVAFIDSLKEKRWSKKDRLQLMGMIFRKTSSVFMVETNPFWNLTTHYDIPMDKQPKSAIYMSNHISFSDPFILCSAQRPIETKYVGKGDLWDIPIAGRALANSGDMPVHFVKDVKLGRWRAKTGNIDELMETARDYLENDMPLTIFPEGTISRDGGLFAFKKGFFQLAVDMGIPIIPVAMWGNQDAWGTDPHNHKVSVPSVLLSRAELDVRIGKPISSKGLTVDELLEETWLAIQKMRNEFPNCNLPKDVAVREPTSKAPKIFDETDAIEESKTA